MECIRGCSDAIRGSFGAVFGARLSACKPACVSSFIMAAGLYLVIAGVIMASKLQRETYANSETRKTDADNDEAKIK